MPFDLLSPFFNDSLLMIVKLHPSAGTTSLLIIFVALLSFQNIEAQQDRLNNLNSELQVLSTQRDRLMSEVSVTDAKIDSVRELISELRFQEISEASLTLTVATDAPIFEDDVVTSDRIGRVEDGQRVAMTSIGENNFVEIRTEEIAGYVYKWNFNEHSKQQLEPLFDQAERTAKESLSRVQKMRYEIEQSPFKIPFKGIPLKEEPSSDSETVEVFLMGREVFINEESGNWKKVSAPRISRDYRQRIDTEQELRDAYIVGWINVEANRPSDPKAEIAENNIDEFTGYRIIRSKFVEIGHENFPGRAILSATFIEGEHMLHLSVRSDDSWQLLGAETAYFLIDGRQKRFSINEIDSDVSGGTTSEDYAIPLTKEEFSSLGEANEIRFRINGNVYELPTIAIQSISLVEEEVSNL